MKAFYYPEIYLLKNEISNASLRRNEVISSDRILRVGLFESSFCYYDLEITAEQQTMYSLSWN